MKTNRGCSLVATVLLSALAFRFLASAQIYEELYSFSSVPPDGGVPHGGLVEGPDGNFYGTTFYGGTYDYGSVFRIDPLGKLTVVASFDGTSNGRFPDRTLLLADNGDFYGLTWQRQVFRVSTSGTLAYLGGFGADPVGELVQGTDSYIYGVVAADDYGYNYGFTYRIPLAWHNGQLLHEFSGPRYAQDGNYPNAGLIQAKDGNLYGTTSGGGAYGYGVVYRITTNGTYTAMCSFNRGPGLTGAAYPYGRLLQASDGSFYGIAGTADGTVFKMTSTGALSTIAWFDYYTGIYPNGGLIEANDGCFYGTAAHGGINIGASGTVFRMTPDGNLAGLFSFTGNTGPYPGSNPYAGLVQGSDGNLYGTSGGLGTRGAGNVFRIVMPGPQLALTNVAGMAILSWRTNYTGFTLQGSTDLSAGNWTDLTNEPAAASGRFWVTNTLSGTPQFFRLKK